MTHRKRFVNYKGHVDDRIPYDYNVDVSSNVIPGMSSMHKYGYNPDIDTTELLISPTGDITIPTLARIHRIKSDNVADVGACEIEGVDDDFRLREETVLVNGTTGNLTENEYLFIHRKRYMGHGANNRTANVGAITSTAEVDSTVTSVIAIGAGQTQMAMYLIPLLDIDGNELHCAMMSRFAGGFSEATGSVRGCTIQLHERPFDGAWRKKEALPILSRTALRDVHVFGPWENFNPKTWIKLTGKCSHADNEVWGTFSLVLDAR